MSADQQMEESDQETESEPEQGGNDQAIYEEDGGNIVYFGGRVYRSISDSILFDANDQQIYEEDGGNIVYFGGRVYDAQEEEQVDGNNIDAQEEEQVDGNNENIDGNHDEYYALQEEEQVDGNNDEIEFVMMVSNQRGTSNFPIIM